MINRALFSTVSGVFLHHGLLRRVEFDDNPYPLLFAFVGGALLLLIAEGLRSALVSSALFTISLSSSILVYRAFFHPLKKFSGPFAARLTKFWQINQVIKTKGQWFLALDQLKTQYGDFVRTGPRELTVFDSNMIPLILYASANVTKAPMYGSMEKTLHMNRDRAFHRQRRKVWEIALKDASADYASRVEHCTDQLLSRISRSKGRSVSLNELCSNYSYDVMGTLAFGGEMGFTNGTASEDATKVLETIVEGVAIACLLFRIPWLLSILTPLAPFISTLRCWNEWTRKEVEKRRRMKNPPPDIMTHLLAASKQNEESQALLFGDARLLISAGSDTTSTTLTFTFIHLAAYPKYVDQLRAEIREHSEEYSCGRPRPILDSIINETLRLFPPVVINAPRLTPAEGITISGIFIPGNTIVCAPIYSFARDERNFLRPNDFVPERWTTRPDMVINRAAFLPFSTGQYSCVGKPVAYMEVRSVITRVIKEYDVVLPSDFDLQDYCDNISDHGALAPPKQSVNFVPRSVN